MIEPVVADAGRGGLPADAGGRGVRPTPAPQPRCSSCPAARSGDQVRRYNESMVRDRKMYHALLAAIDADDPQALAAVLQLVKKPAEYADAKPRDGITPLIRAVEGGQTRVLAALLDAGAGIHGSRSGEDSALALATRAGHAETVAELLRLRPAASWTLAEEREAMEAAASENRPDLMELLPAGRLKQDDFTGFALYAALCGHAQVLRLLMERGVPIGSRLRRDHDDGESTLLHEAAGRARAGAVCLLPDADADPDARDVRGRTPLMLAVLAEPLEVACRAAEVASRTAPEEEGVTRVFNALPDPPPVERADTAVGLLLAAGADATSRDEDGSDALSLMVQEFGVEPGSVSGSPNVRSMAADAQGVELAAPCCGRLCR